MIGGTWGFWPRGSALLYLVSALNWKPARWLEFHPHTHAPSLLALCIDLLLPVYSELLGLGQLWAQRLRPPWLTLWRRARPFLTPLDLSPHHHL